MCFLPKPENMAIHARTCPRLRAVEFFYDLNGLKWDASVRSPVNWQVSRAFFVWLAMLIEIHGGTNNEKMENFIRDNGIKCPLCGKADFTQIRKFNLMFFFYKYLIIY